MSVLTKIFGGGKTEETEKKLVQVTRRSSVKAEIITLRNQEQQYILQIAELDQQKQELTNHTTLVIEQIVNAQGNEKVRLKEQLNYLIAKINTIDTKITRLERRLAVVQARIAELSKTIKEF